VGASRHEALVSDEVVAPPVCAHRVLPDRGVVLPRGNPPGAAVDAGLDAVVRALWAARAADGGGVDVAQALSVSPHAAPMHAQRAA
jgi:hypothetical protein